MKKRINYKVNNRSFATAQTLKRRLKYCYHLIGWNYLCYSVVVILVADEWCVVGGLVEDCLFHSFGGIMVGTVGVSCIGVWRVSR